MIELQSLPHRSQDQFKLVSLRKKGLTSKNWIFTGNDHSLFSVVVWKSPIMQIIFVSMYRMQEGRYIYIRENRCIINWNGRIFRHLKWQSSWNLTRFHYFDTVLRKIDSFNCNDVVRFLFFIPWVPLNLCKIIGSIVLTTWWQSEKIEFFKWTTIYEASYKIQLEIIV